LPGLRRSWPASGARCPAACNQRCPGPQVKSYLRHQDYPSVDRAVKYTEWKEAGGRSVAVVSNNEYLSNPAHLKSMRVVLALSRGGRCFNRTYYTTHNRYVPPTADWQHYALWGQFQGMKAQYDCEPDYTQVEALLQRGLGGG
jgi:hypothetical protein